jgi:hypothetical protein
VSDERRRRVPRFPIEAGHIHVFAAAIGDSNPAFQVAGGAAIAPPTFTIAAAHFDPDFPLRPRTGQPWPGSGAGPSESMAEDVACQSSAGRAPEVLGDSLTVAATVSAVRPLDHDGSEVDLELVTNNQEGDTVLTGTATVTAPAP